MNKEEKLPAGEDRVPYEVPPQQQPVNEVPSAMAEKDEDISSTEPVAKTEKAAIINLQPENMEVHHHGHVHERKKWKEYLFQFLMLILAVFCGFLAEYQLEQTIEKHKEKDFAIQLGRWRLNDKKLKLFKNENENKSIPYRCYY